MATGIGLTVSFVHLSSRVIAVRMFLFQILFGRPIRYIYVLVSLSQLTPHPPSGALMVTHLDPDGPAAKGGLIAPYDVLYEVDETR
jgi:hypothetical protein